MSEGDNDNENVTLLPEHMFIRSIDTDLQSLISQSKGQDKVVLEAIEALKTQGIPPMQSSLSDWKTEDNLVFFKNKCYVPNDAELRRNVVT